MYVSLVFGKLYKCFSSVNVIFKDKVNFDEGLLLVLQRDPGTCLIFNRAARCRASHLSLQRLLSPKMMKEMYQVKIE